MGREVSCLCQCGSESATVRALLESAELILRGKASSAIRRKIPFAEIQQLLVQGEDLTLTHQGEAISLHLGKATAGKWAQIIQAPPVTLAQKLGITPESVVWKTGRSTDSALEAALNTAKRVTHHEADDATLILALIGTRAELISALETSSEKVRKGAPLWLIYPKGKGHAISEADVRSAALATGIVDNKVASISSIHTGLRFVLRKLK
jgi:hypothetical protein